MRSRLFFLEMSLPPLLRPTAVVSREESDAFDAYAAALTTQLGSRALAAMAVFTVAWWPLDWVVGSGPRYLEAFQLLRTRALVIELTTLASLLWWPWARSNAVPLAITAFCLFLGNIGDALGRLGGTDLGFLGDASLGVMPVALVPMAVRWRAPATALVGGSLLAGFFLLHPANVRAPGAAAQVSFVGFAVLLSITVGELSHRATWHAFFQRRALDAVNGALASLSDSLARQVAERTAELQALAGHLENALETERRRIARDLHDDLGQRLTALRYAAARIEDRVPHDEPLASLFEDLQLLLDGAVETTRDVVAELRPKVLDEVGLCGAVRWLCERTAASSGLEISLASEGFPDTLERPDPNVSLCLFRVAQEALNNALRHGRPRHIAVALRTADQRFELTVRDDGQGFVPSQPTRGFGLLGMRERLRAAGGVFDVRAAPGEGTTIVASLPERPTSEAPA